MSKILCGKDQCLFMASFLGIKKTQKTMVAKVGFYAQKAYPKAQTDAVHNPMDNGNLDTTRYRKQNGMASSNSKNFDRANRH